MIPFESSGGFHSTKISVEDVTVAETFAGGPGANIIFL